MSVTPERSPASGVSVSRLEQGPRRLEALYEIGKLFARFENVEQTFEPVLCIVAKTLPLRSAILVETEDGRSRMTVWPSGGQDSAHTRAAKERVAAAYAYLVGAASTESLGLLESAATPPLPGQEEAEGDFARRFILIPLVVANQSLFGALQIEGARPLDKSDLMFVNAIANQLAIALDRDRARRRDIARREYAEALAAENARLYEQERQAVRVREQILAIVSHDLKNPLGTIMLAASLLARGGPRQEAPPPGLDLAVGKIRRSADRMLRLIEDLLDFASIEAGTLALTRQPCEPGSIIDETVASFESVAHEKQQRLTTQVERDLPAVSCDRDRMLQVLSNLVGNATKAIPQGGLITLRAETRPNEVLFSVSDDGPGISEDDLPHLFERYWRSDDAHYKGRGLGLAIARGIVEAHGGQIWAESELGHGATFRFTVPWRALQTQPSGPPQSR